MASSSSFSRRAAENNGAVFGSGIAPLISYRRTLSSGIVSGGHWFCSEDEGQIFFSPPPWEEGGRKQIIFGGINCYVTKSAERGFYQNGTRDKKIYDLRENFFGVCQTAAATLVHIV